jgi:hypothetical protein
MPATIDRQQQTTIFRFKTLIIILCFFNCYRRGFDTLGGIRGAYNIAPPDACLERKLSNPVNLEQVTTRRDAVVWLVRFFKIQIVTETNNKITKLA